VYTNSKDQVSLEESYKQVHNENVVDPNYISGYVPLAATILLLGKLGYNALRDRLEKIKNSSPEKRKELEKINVNEEFKKIIAGLELNRKKYEEAKSRNDTTQVANLRVIISQGEQAAIEFVNKFQEHIDHHSVTDLFKKHGI